MTADVHVVGAGLIGTSIGLALTGRRDVLLSDRSAETVGTAVQRGAGRSWDGAERARLLVVATPPSSIPDVLARAQAADLATTYTHVSSVQSRLQAELERHGAIDVSSVCGSHPLAGRERGGPAAASAELFTGRPWVLCPSPATSPIARAEVEQLVQECGAHPVQATADQHDAAVALVSHLPQVAASAVAALLLQYDAHRGGPVSAQLAGPPPAELAGPAPAELAGPAPAELAGPGIQDTTRIAASDPALWIEVLTQNAAHVAPLLAALSHRLARCADALAALAEQPDDADAQETVQALLRDGNAGRALLPLKPGAAHRDLVAVTVALPDQPGRLAAVLETAARAGINVEDVRLEHLTGRPRGVLELLVQRGVEERARDAFRDAGWHVLS